VRFPLDIWDISLLLAVCATILLVTSELLSPDYGRTSVKISRNKLKNTAIVFSILFLATVVLKIAFILANITV
jgi:hypothetical protein